MSSEIPDPESWARDNIHWFTRHRGHHGIEWVAQICVDGLVFEGSAEGEIRQRDAIRRKAADAAMRNYLEFVTRMEDAG